MSDNPSTDVGPVFKIYYINEDGSEIERDKISKENAYSLYIQKIRFDTRVSDDFMKLVLRIEKLTNTLMFLKQKGLINREYFFKIIVGLKGIADVSFRDENVSASSLLFDIFEMSLINDVFVVTKDKTLKLMGFFVIKFSLPFVFMYLLASMNSSCIEYAVKNLFLDRLVFMSFMMLWVGSLVGVWLAYAMKNSKPTVDDLSRLDVEYFNPYLRLLFIGLLTIVFGLAVFLGVFSLSIGNVNISGFSKNPDFAFLLGVVCGVSDGWLQSVFKKNLILNEVGRNQGR